MMKKKLQNRVRNSWVLALFLALWTFQAHANGTMQYRIFLYGGATSIHANQMVDHIKTAGQAGFNAIVSCDFALENVESQSQKVLDNYAKVMSTAKASNMELLPWHFYQQHGAHENIKLAEALPVKETPFRVNKGTARAMNDPDIGITNGSFESGNPVPQNWKAMGYIPSIDKTVKRSGNASVKYHDLKGFAALTQKLVNLKPYRAYELSVWIRTKGFGNGYGVKFMVLKGNHSLLGTRQAGFGRWGVNGNNGRFTKYVADFNTLGSTTVQLRLLPSEGAASGTIWFDDVSIREVGLYETMRRRGCPVVAKSEDGTKTYAEGTDYTVDPKCDSFDENSFYYEGHLKIPAGSSIKDGQILKVDWHQLANMETRIPETNFCLPETWTTLQNNLNHIDAFFKHSDIMFTGIDEWRVAAWDENCESFQFRTGGEYMAHSWQKIECMLRKTGNGCRSVLTWSDMFDPYHNAAGYHALIRTGNLSGSWNGLSRDVIVVNWNGGNAAKSLRFFGGLDPKHPHIKHKQIINVIYPGEIQDRMQIVREFEKQGGDGIVGCLWAAWFGDYSGITDVANAFKAAGYWGTGPIPRKQCAPATECPPVGIRPSSAASVKGKQAKMSVRKISRTAFQIDCRLPQGAAGSLEAYNTRGQLARTITPSVQENGTGSYMWNTSNIPAGVYFLRLSATGIGSITRKLIVLG